MAIYTSAICSMTNIKTLAHILFQTSFSQSHKDVLKLKKGHNFASTIQQKRKKIWVG